MTIGPTDPPSQQVIYNRGDIWMVDFGNPVGTELGMEHPAVIVSRQDMNNFASRLGRVIAVPGTSTHFTNAKGQTVTFHQEVANSRNNGLDHTTYFMSEQIRSISIVRFRRRLGTMERKFFRELEDRICFVMDLFRS